MLLFFFLQKKSNNWSNLLKAMFVQPKRSLNFVFEVNNSFRVLINLLLGRVTVSIRMAKQLFANVWFRPRPRFQSQQAFGILTCQISAFSFLKNFTRLLGQILAHRYSATDFRHNSWQACLTNLSFYSFFFFFRN